MIGKGGDNMLKKLMLVPLITIGATFAFAKVKEKRSYKSFLIEQVFKMTRSKLTFSTVEGAQRAQSVTQYETKGLHQQPKHQFENTVERCDQNDTTTYIINQQPDDAQDIVLYIHGGAWFKDPLQGHFEFVDQLASELSATIIMPIYQKVPHADYRATFKLITAIYERILDTYQAQDCSRIILMGDSAGGQIALAFAQLLKHKDMRQPDNIVLISPVLDATFNHSATIEYETVDPLLGIQGLNYFLKQWAATLPLEHSILSPINGDMTGLGHITLVIGTKELLYPDALRLSTKLNHNNIEHEFIVGYNQFHIYPIFNIPERRQTINKLNRILKR